MKFRNTKYLFLLLPLFLHAPYLSASEDVDWISGKEPIFEGGADTAIIGTRWGIASRKDGIQISFRLEVQNDMQKGGWLGDIRSTEKFFVKFRLVDHNDNSRYLKLENPRAVGPDAQYGSWKEGPSTSNEQMMTYQFGWDELTLLKSYKSLIVEYAPYDNPDDATDIIFPLDTFNTRLGELETFIRGNVGVAKFIMTREEIENMPIVDLPSAIREGWRTDLEKISSKLSISMDELTKSSRKQIQTLIEEKTKAEIEARQTKVRKAHKAIYDQAPDWIDINLCPNASVQFCNNIGKTAYSDDTMFSDLTHNYGKIHGVVWRSEGAIVRIYGGDVQMNLDPEIYRASKAEYYYIVKNDRGQIDIRPCEGAYTKS